MRIISKFHDYYDSAMRYGIDKECVYVRESKELPYNRPAYRYFDWRRESFDVDTYYRPNTMIQKMIVGFCGNIHRLIKVHYTNWDKYVFHRNELNGAFYSADTLQAWLNTNKDEDIHVDLDSAIRFLNQSQCGDKDEIDKCLKKLFHEYKIPVFLVQETTASETIITLNPNLKSVSFFKMKNTFEAYQEIYQYITGVLGVSQKETVSISDKDMCIKKGFDPKTSFRNPTTYKQLEKLSKRG